MTYYKQFAEILGLELEQEFILTTPYGEKANLTTYKITEDGIRYKSATRDDWFATSNEILESLLIGELKVVPKPWKPKYGKAYWYYIDAKRVDWTCWNSKVLDLLNWKIGNCFRTEEEAETKGKEIIEAIQKEYEEA